MAKPARKKDAPKQLTTAQRLDSIIKSARKIMRKDKGLNGDLDRLPMLTWIMFLKFLDDMEKIEEGRADLSGKDYRPIIEAPYRWRDWAADADGITGPDLLSFLVAEMAERPDGTRGEGLFKYLRSRLLNRHCRTDHIPACFHRHHAANAIQTEPANVHDVFDGNDALVTVFSVFVFQRPGSKTFNHHVLRQQRHQRNQAICDEFLLNEGVPAQTNTGDHHQHKAGWCHF